MVRLAWFHECSPLLPSTVSPTALSSGQLISAIMPMRSSFPLATINPLRAILAPAQGDYIQNNKQSEYNKYCEHNGLLICHCLLFIYAVSSVLVGFYSAIVQAKSAIIKGKVKAFSYAGL